VHERERERERETSESISSPQLSLVELQYEKKSSPGKFCSSCRNIYHKIGMQITKSTDNL
jgi:hypothetical protein